MKPLSQSYIPGHPSSIPVRTFTRRAAGNAASILSEMNSKYFGLAIQLNNYGALDAIALATHEEVFLISIDSRNGLLVNDKPFENLLAEVHEDNEHAHDEPKGVLVGFDMARLALLVHRDLKLHVRGIDLSTCFSPSTKDPWRPSQLVASKVYHRVNKIELEGLWSGQYDETNRNVCLRAWFSVLCAPQFSPHGFQPLKVDTRNLSSRELECLVELIRQEELLEREKPLETISDFSNFVLQKDGDLELQNARYKTRVKQSQFAKVIMTNAEGREFVGEARSVKGRRTTIKMSDNAAKIGSLQTVKVVGRQELLNCEKALGELVLFLLQGKCQLDSRFVRKIWFPKKKGTKEDTEASHCPFDFGLNPSQMETVSTMISPQPLVIIHGPPGTGKTTTIAAAAAVWSELGEGAWIIAHSNVAVKNIAEKLFDKNVDFKIIVSKEFHFEWHEHIYNKIDEKLIRSDEIPKDPTAMERLLGGSSVVLSTLSMLSNPAMDQAGVFKLVPLRRLVVDEASQIRLFEFLFPFQKFRKELEKVCFFGDPKQLPPFGQDKVPEMMTIFDVEHLRPAGLLLDTQYRMPTQLGDFISRYVYENKVKSQHKNTSKTCISFVDCDKGCEVRAGTSWKNLEEIQTVTHLVRTYYKSTEFCIITPYDAQRAAIERRLQDENLPWESVFNVDSFQGNEADYVIISVVRSHNPGFLTSLNRMNVMLTRCKKGLVVVTNRSFIRGGGAKTLLGDLANYWEGIRGCDSTWVNWRQVAEGIPDMPDVLGPNRHKARASVDYWSRPSVPAPINAPRTFDVSKLFRKREHAISADTTYAGAVTRPPFSWGFVPTAFPSQQQFVVIPPPPPQYQIEPTPLPFEASLPPLPHPIYVAQLHGSYYTPETTPTPPSPYASSFDKQNDDYASSRAAAANVRWQTVGQWSHRRDLTGFPSLSASGPRKESWAEIVKEKKEHLNRYSLLNPDRKKAEALATKQGTKGAVQSECLDHGVKNEKTKDSVVRNTNAQSSGIANGFGATRPPRKMTTTYSGSKVIRIDISASSAKQSSGQGKKPIESDVPRLKSGADGNRFKARHGRVDPSSLQTLDRQQSEGGQIKRGNSKPNSSHIHTGLWRARAQRA